MSESSEGTGAIVIGGSIAGLLAPRVLCSGGGVCGELEERSASQVSRSQGLDGTHLQHGHSSAEHQRLERFAAVAAYPNIASEASVPVRG